MTRPRERVVGVDPGGRTTGIVAQVDGHPIFTSLVTRRDPARPYPPGVDDDGLARHIREVAATVETAIAAAAMAGDTRLAHLEIVVAVEDIVDPNPHLGVTALRGLLDTAQVLGHLRGVYPQAVLVRPRRHGSGPLSTYPKTLIGPRESKGAGRFRHLRSAWDVARAAIPLIRHHGSPE